MKKYLPIIAVLFTVLLSSCSNDDIPVGKTTTFKVNPNTVISGFEEWKAGDLTVINSYFQLRVHLLVYNESGKLVSEDVQHFGDYAHVMTSNLNLSDGERYRAIAITDIVRKSDSFEYWSLIGKRDLSTLKLSDTGYIGGQRNILGIASTDFVCGEMSQVSIDVQPAGALLIVYYEGIRSWSNISEYELGINRSADYVSFNHLARPEWNVQASSSYDWRISNIKVSDFDDRPNTKNIYDYVFAIPYGQTNMLFRAKKKSPAEWIALTQSISLNLAEGTEFFISCDIAEQKIEYEQLVNSRSFSDRLAQSRFASGCLLNINSDHINKVFIK